MVHAKPNFFIAHKVMSPDLLLRGGFNGDDDVKDEEFNDLDLNQSVTSSCYSPPCLPTLDNVGFNDFSSSFDEIRSHKRLRRTPSLDEPCFSNTIISSATACTASNGLNAKLRQLQFRDHVWAYTQRYLAIEAVEYGIEDENNNDEGYGTDDMKLVQQLIAFAEAVACHDTAQGSSLLSELRSSALVFGTSFQRVASCFVQGLSDRLALVNPLGAFGTIGPQSSTTTSTGALIERDEALCLVYEICPQLKFGHFVANASILEAFEGESYVHVVDLGMTFGLPFGNQWRDLIHSLANRAGKPLHCLRITGVGNDAKRFQSIGDELNLYAQNLGIKFEFQFIETSLEDIQVKDFNLYKEEVVVINSILQLHYAVKESRGALNSVLQVLRELSPRLLVLVEQDSSHNGPFFLGRFMEALHYYSAIFDSLDAMLPKYDTRRAKIEQFFYAEEIKNIVSCEGPARVERHERLDQWRRRMSRAGFQPAALKTVEKARQWLKKINAFEGFTVMVEKGCSVLGWKSKPIIAVSCWTC